MMKFLALIITVVSLSNTFSCPNINMSNLTCEDSGFGSYTLKEITINNNLVRVDGGAGDIMEFTLPQISENSSLECVGDTLVETTKEGNFTITTKTTFSNGKISYEGSRFVYRCDDKECDEGNYYVEGIEKFVASCY